MRNKPFIHTIPETLEDGSNAPTVTTLPNTTEPQPGATNRKKDPLPPKEKSPGRPRKLLTTQELTQEETQLRAKYPHLVPNSLLNATKDQPHPKLTDNEIHKFRHKRSCLIQCTCGAKRRIATSDLAQVTLCPNCTKNARNARKRAHRAETKK